MNAASGEPATRPATTKPAPEPAGPRVLIVAGTSAIAEACARLWARRGARLYLTGRNEQRLAAIAADLQIRGARDVGTGLLDACQLPAHGPALAAATHFLGAIDIALIAHGSLPDPAQCERSPAATVQALAANGGSTIALMNALAGQLEDQGHGTLAVISSVAGDRGRASNGSYGAAKAAVSAYASALRQRLSGSGANVLTIKPGLVDTPMTRDLRKGLLWAQPDTVARGIVRAIDRRRSVVYLPWFWRPVMAVIRALPEAVFRRLRF